MGNDLAGVNLLARLVAESTEATGRRQAMVAVGEVERRAAAYSPRDFAGALHGDRLAVIAEMKRRTPSMGVLTQDYRPAELAQAYTSGGAAALSVLTQEESFGGSLADLEAARAHSMLPILRKDFITDPYQVLEARAHGADAVLLIVAALSRQALTHLLAAAGAQGLAALVEVHDEQEADTAVAAGARLIGVNHRDLRTFDVDLGLTERLRPRLPGDVTLVAESGIHGADGARRMRAAGASAVLVGEALMRAADPAAVIRELRDA
ncbi:MAG TPA: indole-3-glycerol phosphate synthase TrpC [Candidatus Dormibacteraeota bacterium]|nr:indole-3-glycerol phosphate synthase TrpC [Candidatus Dormibacteraeota bacterium]